MRLGVDPTHAEQMVRSTVALPNGTGKTVRVIAFVNEEKMKEAKAAGAEKAGMEELIEEIAKGWLGFDVAVATPEAMKSLGKIAKILGTKGLMPNPKAGTVTADVGKAIKEFATGKMEFKNDDSGNVHMILGKASFDKEKLMANFQAFIDALKQAKPTGIKKEFIQSVSMHATMGPSIKVKIK